MHIWGTEREEKEGSVRLSPEPSQVVTRYTGARPLEPSGNVSISLPVLRDITTGREVSSTFHCTIRSHHPLTSTATSEKLASQTFAFK